jgi:predicted nucleic acid-binding protein
VALVVDASVGMKWVIPEPDSWMAHALVMSGEKLLMPDFWLNEACNVLWVQVRKSVLTRAEAVEALLALRETVEPTPTLGLDLYRTALEIGMSVSHSPYDTLYVAFALATGAERVIVADRPFTRAMRAHPDPVVAGMLMPISDWVELRGVGAPS